MQNDNVPSSNDKTTIVQTDADLVSSVIRQHRPNITSLIETSVLKHTSRRKARLLKVDSNKTEKTSLSLPRTGEKIKSVPPEASDKKFKKEKFGKPSISGSMYVLDVTEDGNVTSALYVKKEKYGKPSISGSMYLRDVKEDGNVPLSLTRAAGRKRKRELTEASDRKFKKEKHDKLSIVGSTYQHDVTEDGKVSSPYSSL